jgi:hypothetical protein
MTLANNDYDGGSETNGGDDYYGGEESLSQWANKRGVFLFWIAAISVSITVLIFLLWTMGNVQIGRSVVSYYSSSTTGKNNNTVSRFGNNPNWRMGYGDAGFGSSVDIPGTDRSLGFNTEADCPLHGSNISSYKNTRNGIKSQFVDHLSPTPGRPGISGISGMSIKPGVGKNNFVDHLDNDAAAAAAAARAEREARQKMYEDQVMRTCADPWDPMATEEARVLSSVGSYSNAAGLGAFNKAINTNCTATLTDAQLEAIMQGKDSFNVDYLSGTLNTNLANNDLLQRQQAMGNQVGGTILPMTSS